MTFACPGLVGTKRLTAKTAIEELESCLLTGCAGIQPLCSLFVVQRWTKKDGPIEAARRWAEKARLI